MDISDITMFITKMNEAFGLITESFREMAEALKKLFVCFGENEEEEKISVSSTKPAWNISERHSSNPHKIALQATVRTSSETFGISNKTLPAPISPTFIFEESGFAQF